MTHTKQLTINALKKAKELLEEFEVPEPHYVYAPFPSCLRMAWLGFSCEGDYLYKLGETN